MKIRQRLEFWSDLGSKPLSSARSDQYWARYNGQVWVQAISANPAVKGRRKENLNDNNRREAEAPYLLHFTDEVVDIWWRHYILCSCLETGTISINVDGWNVSSSYYPFKRAIIIQVHIFSISNIFFMTYHVSSWSYHILICDLKSNKVCF